jgi:hypothetical protein
MDQKDQKDLMVQRDQLVLQEIQEEDHVDQQVHLEFKENQVQMDQKDQEAHLGLEELLVVKDLQVHREVKVKMVHVVLLDQ